MSGHESPCLPHRLDLSSVLRHADEGGVQLRPPSLLFVPHVRKQFTAWSVKENSSFLSGLKAELDERWPPITDVETTDVTSTGKLRMLPARPQEIGWSSTRAWDKVMRDLVGD